MNLKINASKHKKNVKNWNTILYIAAPIVTVIIYLLRDVPAKQFIWQDYLISLMLFIVPLIYTEQLRRSRNNIEVEQRNRDTLKSKWNTVAKVTHEGVSEDLKQEIYNLKMSLSLLQDKVEDHDAKIDNHEVRLDAVTNY